MRVSIILKVFGIIFLCYLVEAQSTQDVSSIFGMSPVNCDGGVSYLNNIPAYPTDHHAELYIFGNNLKSDLEVGVSGEKDCNYVVHCDMKLETGTKGQVAKLSLTTPGSDYITNQNHRFFVCLKEPGQNIWTIQQSNNNIGFYVYKPDFAIPFYIMVIIIIFCFMMSSLMSGLNIGLMSLDHNELHLLKNAGTEKEKKYAKRIIPVRRNGNYLLCSILITATLCNCIATVCIERYVNDWITVVITTVVIVLLCEILPQSVCTSFPLFIGANTVYITRACMFITFPLSYPLSLLLNLVLGKEIVYTYTKERLKELLKLTQLPTNEEKIITGALELSQKRVEEVMTMLDDVFKLPITAVMDFETISLILASGYSRIPIYIENNANIVHVLLTKDLALLDPDDKVPVKVLVQNSKLKCRYMLMGTTLDSALEQFKISREHMAFIVDRKVSSDKEKHVVGLITFEDVIEEVFQMEINDETDKFSDNRTMRRLTVVMEDNEMLALLKKNARKSAEPSENLKLATFHFLSGIDLFSNNNISAKMLLKLLAFEVFFYTPGAKKPEDNLYVQGVRADYFIMILEGLAEVKIGTENLKFEAGAFKYFGLEALRGPIGSKEEPVFKPDYTLQTVKKTLYLKVPLVLYQAAVLATRSERFKEVPDISVQSELYNYYRKFTTEDDTI